MPRLLSPQDVASFRDRLCEAAERLFAEQGPEAVTMRQLASELGCSPMTPYRYFKDKDEILAAVRTAAFDRFSEALDHAELVNSRDVEVNAQGVGRAYVGFALSEPHAYRLMFDVLQPEEGLYPAMVRATARVKALLTRYLTPGTAGLARSEIERFGEAQWAAMHGAVMLHLAGKLSPGVEAAALVETLIQGLCSAFAPLGERRLVHGS